MNFLGSPFTGEWRGPRAVPTPPWAGSIIAGNALAVVTGLSWEPLGLPRRLAFASLAAGGLGLINIPLTYGWVPTGLAERISLYSYLCWALITGIVVIRTRNRDAAR